MTPLSAGESEFLTAALWYAELGIPIFPLHSVQAGQCSCSNPQCGSPGKHPRIRDWQPQASMDRSVLMEWWKTWPDANLGLPTGVLSGLVVLDEDPRHGGVEGRRVLEAEHEVLPVSWEVLTGGGGLHVYLKYPDRSVPNSVGRLGRGLDVRGDGGFVIVPPSLHASGGRYAWKEGRRPGEVDLAELPEWLIEILSRVGPTNGNHKAPQVTGQIKQGSRNSTLASLAGSMRRRGMSEEAMAAALLEENAAKCQPPLSETEVRKIAESIAGYEPAAPPIELTFGEGLASAKETVAKMLAEVEADPGAPFEMDAMRALAALRSSSPADYERARAKLHDLGVGIARLERETKERFVEEDLGSELSESGIIAALASQAELFHTPDGEGFATFPVETHRETWAVRSPYFRRWLMKKYYEQEGSPPKTQALMDALCLLEARAQFEGEEREVFVRVAGDERQITIDLSNKEWDVVEITPFAFTVVKAAEVRFRRSRGMSSLPHPTRGGSVEVLRQFINVATDDDWYLLVVWLTAACRPKGPYAVLGLHGEQGSAKSTTARVLRTLIDPNVAPLRSEPREGRDLMIAARNSWALSFDNLSSLRLWLSDGLCRLATGGGFSTRELYSDAEELIIDAQRPIVLNGIEELAERGDLIERSVIIELPTIPEEKRKSERQFWTEFERAHPGLLGGLYGVISAAMRELPGVHLERLPRMADFALWGTAVEKAMGWPTGSFLNAYLKCLAGANEQALEASNLAPVIQKFADQQPAWSGSATELREAMARLVEEKLLKAEWWPKTPAVLSGVLRRLAPNLRKVGVQVSFSREGRRGKRSITIRGGQVESSPLVGKAGEVGAGVGLQQPQADARADVADAAPTGSASAEVLETGSLSYCQRSTSCSADDADDADALFPTTSTSDDIEVTL